MRSLAIVTLLFLVSPLWADLKITGPLQVEATKLVRLEAETDLKTPQFLWDVTAGADLEECGKRLVFTGPAGTYEVRLTAIDFDAKRVERARVQVVIGKDPSPPPPVPPPPVPPVPPDDSLTRALRTAYAGESDPLKADQIKSLASLYRQGAEIASKTEIDTWGRLFTVMSGAATTLGVAGKLPLVQAEVRKELGSLPTERQRPLDAAGRAQARATFLKVATALDAVMKGVK